MIFQNRTDPSQRRSKRLIWTPEGNTLSPVTTETGMLLCLSASKHLGDTTIRSKGKARKDSSKEPSSVEDPTNSNVCIFEVFCNQVCGVCCRRPGEFTEVYFKMDFISSK